MLKAIIKEFNSNLGFRLSESTNKPLLKPRWVYVSLSHKCNLNCQMCGVRKILKGQELDFNLLKSIFKEISQWGSDSSIVLTGGEPFLRQDIFDIIGYAASCGLNVELVTNGSLIQDYASAERIIHSGLKNIAVSLDGACAKTHDYIRGTAGSYDKAVGALKLLCQAKKKIAGGPQISSWVTIMKENVRELYDIIPLAEEIGLECLVYHPVVVNQDDMQNTIKAGRFWLNKADIGILKHNIKRIVAYQKKNNFVHFLHDPYLWADYFSGTLTKERWRCNPFVFIDIGPDGYVRSCGPAFGNVKEMSLSECLDTKEAQMARERMRLCRKPCLQTCWAKPEADSMDNIINSFFSSIESFPASDKIQAMEEALASLCEYKGMVQELHS